MRLIFPYLGSFPNKVIGAAGGYFLLYIRGLNGGRSRARTVDPLIKSQLLYQLS